MSEHTHIQRYSSPQLQGLVESFLGLLPRQVDGAFKNSCHVTKPVGGRDKLPWSVVVTRLSVVYGVWSLNRVEHWHLVVNAIGPPDLMQERYECDPWVGRLPHSAHSWVFFWRSGNLSNANGYLTPPSITIWRFVVNFWGDQQFSIVRHEICDLGYRRAANWSGTASPRSRD